MECGGGTQHSLCRERKPPCSVLYVDPQTRTLHAGGIKARADNARRYLTLARAKSLRRASYVLLTFGRLHMCETKWNKRVSGGNTSVLIFFIITGTKMDLVVLNETTKKRSFVFWKKILGNGGVSSALVMKSLPGPRRSNTVLAVTNVPPPTLVTARALYAFPAALQIYWHGPITFQKGHECVHTTLHCNTLTWETQHKYNLYAGRRVLWAGVEFMGKV